MPNVLVFYSFGQTSIPSGTSVSGPEGEFLLSHTAFKIPVVQALGLAASAVTLEFYDAETLERLPPDTNTRALRSGMVIARTPDGQDAALVQGLLRVVPALREQIEAFKIEGRVEPLPVMVLFLASNVMSHPLNLDKEARDIRTSIRLMGLDRFQFEQRTAIRPIDLLRELVSVRPDIVHFAGHGSDQNELMLLDDSDRAVPFRGKGLERLFRTVSEHVRLVVLNACFSESIAKSLVSSIDCCVGMSRAVSDETATKFSERLYSSIGAGRSVQTAFDQACALLAGEFSDEEDTPRLLTRDGVSAAAVTFGR